MVTVVQLHRTSGASSGAAALGALADGLAPPERELVARALEFAEPLYAGQALSTGEPMWPHALGLGASLAAIGVDPAAQGTGLGRALVADGLARAAADGLPVYLQTYRIENVAWYSTLGFEVVSEGSHADVPHGWGMRWTPLA